MYLNATCSNSQLSTTIALIYFCTSSDYRYTIRFIFRHNFVPISVMSHPIEYDILCKILTMVLIKSNNCERSQVQCCGKGKVFYAVVARWWTDMGNAFSIFFIAISEGTNTLVSIFYGMVCMHDGTFIAIWF